jgi:NAD(P)-dependent dehydrogenase (short-subunit alcohol dehydrogenase family)
MPTVLITGAGRGLGLEFCGQFAAAGWRVYAACRNPDGADALNAMASEAAGSVTIHRLDVTNHEQIDAVARELEGEGLDLLLNNAGVYGSQHKDFGDIDYASWVDTLRANTLGPMRVAEGFVGHVARSRRKLIVCISSKMGSIADNAGGGAYIYRSSKAALNVVVKSLAVDLRDRGITVVAFHPGWVATDMGGSKAPLTPTESVAAMRALIERLSPADSGRFLNYDGAEILW